ncbi:MAG: chlorophyll synthesis pathway protein BchC [Proteobacteria bacterium]|nr:chlorophyll synthesis pathway protein BchC [Pseudomonadota bacterium]
MRADRPRQVLTCLDTWDRQSIVTLEGGPPVATAPVNQFRSPAPAAAGGFEALAVVLEAPERLALARLELSAPGEADVVVDVDWSGISTGTERLLWSGRMPPFPGLGYPLVPGYESVGRITQAGPQAGRRVGEHVFVPGARCFGPVRGLFGGAASRLVVPAARVTPIDPALAERGVLLALAATAQHALAAPGAVPPALIVGHGVLGRLLARLAVARGGAPVVWERDPARRAGAAGYSVIGPDDDPRRDYPAIYDVSGDPTLLDELIGRLAPRGEVVLAGFYSERPSFAFPPAFMREARLRIAAEWQPPDLAAVSELVARGELSLDGLITHRERASTAASAYRTAFTDPACLKMLLDWRNCA